MPYIHITTEQHINPSAMEQIKSELGKAIALIPGKEERSLMIGFDQADLYLGGEKGDAAFVRVKIFSTTSKEAFRNLGAAISNILHTHAGISADRIYINFEEHFIWGVGEHTHFE